MPVQRHDLLEIKALLEQAEALTDQLVNLVPPESSWLKWRGEGLRKRIQRSREDLKALIDKLQVFLLEEAAAQRHCLGFTVSRNFPYRILSFHAPGDLALPLAGKPLREVFDPTVTFRYEQALKFISPAVPEVMSHAFKWGSTKMRWQVKLEDKGEEFPHIFASVRYVKIEPQSMGLGL